MDKKRIKQLTIGVWILAAIIFLFNIGLGIWLHSNKSVSPRISITPPINIQKSITYKGEKGKDALTLLKKHAKVEQASSGLVKSINGHKAQDTKKEYWAFYVNEKLAEVGPADYTTKDTDTITWRIDTY